MLELRGHRLHPLRVPRFGQQDHPGRVPRERPFRERVDDVHLNSHAPNLDPAPPGPEARGPEARGPEARGGPRAALSRWFSPPLPVGVPSLRA
nr:hypothetical protein GCM10020241_41930 [Streptoalloteichus tenebrarius]